MNNNYGYDDLNNGYQNGNVYDSTQSGYGSYTSSAVSSEETQSKVITRAFLIMFAALLITAGTATYVAANVSLFINVINAFQILIFVELAVVIATSVAVKKKSSVASGAFFTAYCIINGMTISSIFYVFELQSIQSIFLLTALMFGIMAAIGAATKINLSKMGSVLMMALIGVLLVTFGNMIFFHNSGLDLALDYICVFIFVGLTAYDTQKLKRTAMYTAEEDVNVMAVSWGMELYLDFINLFLRLLIIFGKRKN